MKQKNLSSGFTLVEMSIVLVIVALLISFITIGRKLISTAEGKAILTEMTSYQTAVSMFQNKFKYLPGDLPAADAVKNFPNIESSDQGGDGSGGWNNIEERHLLWRHLYAAEMIESRTKTSGGVASMAVDVVAMPGGNRPESKVGGVGYTFISNMNICPATAVSCNVTYGVFTRVLRVGASDATSEYLRTPGVPVKTHKYIDEKVDTPNTPFSGKYTVSSSGANKAREFESNVPIASAVKDTCGVCVASDGSACTNNPATDWDIYPEDENMLCLGQLSETNSR
jgi:prepilin-type N-terminal cleavage/methylation domain-containing protein